MTPRLNTPLALSLCGLLLTGMGGCATSKVGKEMRTQAQNRMDAVNAQLSYDQAHDSFKVGEFDGALTHIQAAIARYPDEAQFHILHGRILLEMGNLEPSASAFEAAVATQADVDRENIASERLSLIDKTMATAHYYLGIIFQRWSNDQTSFDHYSQAMELDTENVQYVLASAEALIALQRFEEAEQLIIPKMDYFEHNAALHHLLGQIAMLKGQADQAVQKYEEARLLRPDDQFLLEELIWTQYGAAMYGKCYETVKEYQIRFPAPKGDERMDLEHLEARCLALMDRTQDARNLYLRLSREKPGDADVWSELGAVAWELGDYRRVALCGVRIIALSPNRYEGYLLKAINEQHHGNAAEAMELLRQAADLAHDTPLPHIMLGRALEQNGQVGEAMLAYGTALQIEPDHEEAQVLLANLNVLQQQQQQQMTVVPTEQ